MESFPSWLSFIPGAVLSLLVICKIALAGMLRRLHRRHECRLGHC